ncbi:DUF6044 family protein [Paramagnetospirillum magneticum]|nr:DUF6044 family protein [Paramagnetospirillum magneticum]
MFFDFIKQDELQGLARLAPFIIFIVLAVMLSVKKVGYRNVKTRNIITISILAIMGMAAEYVLPGNSSFINFVDEGDVFVPIYLYFEGLFAGGSFAQAVAGGNDAIGMLASGGQFFSLEMLLIKVFPLWAAIAIHKVSVFGISLLGSWLLLHRGMGLAPILAVGFGVWYGLSSFDLYMYSLQHGISMAAIPLSIYLMVVRADKGDQYYRWIIPLAALLSTSTLLTHSMMALMFSLMVATIMLGLGNWRRKVAAITILFVFVCLNWADVITSFTQLSQGASRQPHLFSFHSLLSFNFWRTSQGEKLVFFYISLIISLAICVIYARRDGLRYLSGLVFCLLANPIIMLIPWERLGLGFVLGIDFGRLTYGFAALGLIPMARASLIVAERWKSPLAQGAPLAVCLSLAIGALLFQKASTIVQYLGEGGQAVLTKVPNLRDRPWQTDPHGRVVTIPHLIVPFAPLAYGLETFDGYLNLQPMIKARFWSYAKKHLPIYSGRNTFIENQLYLNRPMAFDMRCCDRFSLDDMIDQDFLRLGGVRYVVSYVPLGGNGLRQISGPHAYVARHKKPFRQKIEEDLRQIASPGEVFVYETTNSQPIAFFASSVTALSAEASDEEVYQAAIAGVASRKVAVQLPVAPLPQATGQVAALDYVPGGYVAKVIAPEGGLFVLNVPKTRFWTVSIDGRPAEVFAVNGIQMGVEIYPGAREIRFEYRRPRVADLLRRLIHR